MVVLNPRKLLDTRNFTLNETRLTRNQLQILYGMVIFSVVIKIALIPYVMVNGEAVTRVWYAFWWAQKPFFVLPRGGHPFFFYFMGPIIYLTGEIYYTPLISMIIAMTMGGIFLFKITFSLSDFRTALLTFIIFLFTPAIFRLNYNPYPYTIAPVLYVITVYYLLKALFLNESRKYFIIAGIFSFLAVFNRPESLFVTLCFCLIAFYTKKKGYVSFIALSLWFQVFWILLSIIVHDSPFGTFDKAAEYPNLYNIHGLNLPLRFKGFFLPYYYWVLGVTFILFYFLIKGILSARKNYPLVVLITLFIPIIVAALANGTAAINATIFNGTFYIYSMFFFSSIFTAIGINDFIKRYNSRTVRTALVSTMVLSAIPLAYLKDILPDPVNNLFPKAIQFIETTHRPQEIRKICKVVDYYIDQYPSLVLDVEGDIETTTIYVAFRTRRAPPQRIILTAYDLPKDTEGFRRKLEEFMLYNQRGILVSKNSSTKLSYVIQNDSLVFRNFKLQKVENTEFWCAYLFESVQIR